MFEKIKEYFRRRRLEIPEYGLLLFDHSLGEYPSVARSLTGEEKEKCEAIQAKRASGTLTWKDIYTYKLILVGHYDLETLKSKIISLRVKYQCLVTVAEYNNYMTLRAVDFEKLSGEAEIEKMRTDYVYLLDEFFLRYAYISAHEDFRTKLLWRGALFTFFFFTLSGVFILLSFIPDIGTNDKSKILIIFSTLISVVFAGVMGAFVSMQERLQSFSHQGDPIYNLSLLTHGWLSIFLSPISGAIFAAILYLFFAAGILKGTVFPEMTTITTSNNDPSLITELSNFILKTGPKEGKDFALLIIWSFIAGFAERFVPDTLMRLVDHKKTSETTTS